MKQLTKTTSRNQAWLPSLRNRVGDSVSHNGRTYTNTTGKNSEPGFGNDWIEISQEDGLFADVKRFGAKGDAVWNVDLEKYVGTDDTVAIQNAMNSGLDVFIPEGKYLVSSPMFPLSNKNVFGKSRTTSVLVLDGVVNGTPATYFNPFTINGRQNITIDSVGFIDGKVIEYEEFLSFSENCTAISIFNSTHITVKNCNFAFIQGHGIYDGCEEAYNNFINNSGEGCGQNVLNINSKFPTIHYNIGKTSGFGLLEASCGNGSIQFNEAYENARGGLTIGGFAGPVSSGYGSNNIISNNKCYRNEEFGIHLSAHCVDSIISNNIIYENKNFGISTSEPNNISSNLLITKNKIFDNGLTGEISKVGIYVSSKDCTISDNEIYNTGKPGYSTSTGIATDFEKHKQIIKGNIFKNITNWEISIQENNSIDISTSANDRIELLGNVNILNKVNKVGIGYDGQPITNTETWVWGDLLSSPKTAILPDAEKYPEGQILTIIDEKGGAGTNNLTLTVVVGNKIMGVTDDTFVFTNNYQCVQFTNVKSTKNWIIISNNF